MAYYVLTGADQDLTTKGKRLFMLCVTETAGAAAVVNIRNGSVGGDILLPLRFAAVTGGSHTVLTFGHRGLLFPAGVFIDFVSGTVTGSVDID